jgi:hypothetical protein
MGVGAALRIRVANDSMSLAGGGRQLPVVLQNGDRPLFRLK